LHENRNRMMQNSVKWSENVILVDADYTDKVAFDLIVNFERILGRRIPQADLARWIDCLALDGGVREGEHETLVVLIHSKQRQRLENFAPADYESELNGKAFKDHLGEFTITALPVEEMVSADNFFLETVQLVLAQKDVRRVMIVPNAEHIYNKVSDAIHKMDDDDDHPKRVTVFTMEPKTGGNFRQEILGYSLMAALGIRGEEISANSPSIIW